MSDVLMEMSGVHSSLAEDAPQQSHHYSSRPATSLFLHPQPTLEPSGQKQRSSFQLAKVPDHSLTRSCPVSDPSTSQLSTATFPDADSAFEFLYDTFSLDRVVTADTTTATSLGEQGRTRPVVPQESSDRVGVRRLLEHH